MPEYVVGQVVKGKTAPIGCPEGCYWRKAIGRDEFKLYTKKERKGSPANAGKASVIPISRMAAGVRYYMQHEEGFHQVMEAASLSVKALQNLAAWSSAAATAKDEQEKVKATALARANAALKDAGLEIGPSGIVQPIVPR